MDKYQKELSQAAQRLAEIIKARPEQAGMPLKVISGEIVSVNDDNSKAMVSVDGQEISAFNKSGDKLEEGESVWLGYFKTLADSVILFKNGATAPSSGGVGEDLGNHNERFNDYENNEVVSGSYNSVKGQENRVIGSRADIAGSRNTIFGASLSDNVSGDDNFATGDGNIVSGHNNLVGVISQVQMSTFKSLYESAFKGTNDEKRGWQPPFTTGTASGYNMVAGNNNNVVDHSGAIGNDITAADRSFAVGSVAAADKFSAAIGENVTAYGNSIAIGAYVSAGNQFDPHGLSSQMPPSAVLQNIKGSVPTGTKDGCIGVGYDVIIEGINSGAIGEWLRVYDDFCFVCGSGNMTSGYTAGGSRHLVVGDGSLESPSDAFEVYGGTTGVYAKGAYHTVGADYAEFFEWADGNPDNEDRAGRFVTLDGKYIKLADSPEDYILGVVSATPSIVGNSDISCWNGRYEKDIFGRVLTEEKEIEIKHTDKDGNETVETQTITAGIDSPDYDPEREYIPRAQRKEYDAIGMLGQMIVIDDGSCVVNGYCQPSPGGIATATFSRQGYRVIERLDADHIRIIFRG